MSVSSAARRAWLGAVLVAALVLVVYWPALGGGFLLDDHANLTQNPYLRSLGHPGPAWWANPGLGLDGRPLVSFSFALEHALFGLDARVFRVTNLCIHVVNAWLVAHLVRRAWRDLRREGAWVGELTALLWALHPLCTSSVSYVVQRCESLAATAVLAGLCCAQVAFTRDRSWPWMVAVALAGGVGAAAKETVAVLPVLVGVYAYVVGWPRSRRLVGVVLAACASWVVVALLLSTSAAHANSVGLSDALSPLEYLWIQTGALARYARLAVWPDALVFDYGGAQVAATRGSVLGAVFALAALGLCALLLWRRHASSLPLAFVFVTLAPSSSVLPITTQVWAEHRTYLPLVACVAALVAWLTRWPKLALGGALVLASALAVRTWTRNRDYGDSVRLWRSSLDAWEGNARGHDELGTLLRERGQLALAREHYARAVELEPQSPFWRNNLGTSLWQAGELQAAQEQLRAACEASPTHTLARVNLGQVLLDLRRPAEAVVVLREALALRPDALDVRLKYAWALFDAGEFDVAADELGVLLRARPRDAELARRWIEALARREQRAGEAGALAIAQVEQLLPRLAPEDLAWWATCAAAYAQAGNFERALELQQRALEIAQRSNSSALAEQRERLERYRARQPLR